MNTAQLEKKVVDSAEKVLKEKGYVSSLDVLLGINYLTSVNIDDWKKGRIPYLERVVQANLNKISNAMKFFKQWAVRKGLKPSETKYLTKAQEGKRELQFSKSGNSKIELAYRTHYVALKMSEKKYQGL